VRTYHVPDPLHPPLMTVFNTGSHHITFVDDNMMMAECVSILAVINASVLLVYFLYDFPGNSRSPPPLADDKYEPFAHYHHEQLGLGINTRKMMFIWSVYKWMAFRKYLEENWLAPVVRRKLAKCAANM
jgi:hypothetical protein